MQHNENKKLFDPIIWEQISEPIAIFDLRARIVDVNRAMCHLLGYCRQRLLELAPTSLTLSGDPVLHRSAAEKIAREGITSYSEEKRLLRVDGNEVWVLVTLSLLRTSDGNPWSIVAECNDITARRRTEQLLWGMLQLNATQGPNHFLSAMNLHDKRLAELVRMALCDPLTGLANRALLFDRLRQELAALPDQDRKVAVFLIDLDGLKPINDRYGHTAGDQALQFAAHELVKAVRSTDTVARLGGDEFVVLAHAGDEDQAEAMRSRIERLLDVEATAVGHRVKMSASVGMATTCDSSTTTHALVEAADQDMYARKHARV